MGKSSKKSVIPPTASSSSKPPYPFVPADFLPALSAPKPAAKPVKEVERPLLASEQEDVDQSSEDQNASDDGESTFTAPSGSADGSARKGGRHDVVGDDVGSNKKRKRVRTED
ncbi:MAG: hypothetical protein Q9200_003443, partial [Gallowayella weberi]